MPVDYASATHCKAMVKAFLSDLKQVILLLTQLHKVVAVVQCTSLVKAGFNICILSESDRVIVNSDRISPQGILNLLA